MKTLAFFCVISGSAYSLNQTPWIGNPYECTFKSDLFFGTYRFIDGAERQPPHAYRTFVTREGLSCAFDPPFEVEIELELAATSREPYGFRSLALGGLYVLLNDVEGDPVSLTLGGNLRGVGSRSVRDVNSPYASYFNAEVALSVGKEFTKTDLWTSRGFFTGAVGLAGHGSAWNRFSACLEKRVFRPHLLRAWIEGYFGYGPDSVVNIDDFHGWGFVAHRSIDIGVRYAYSFAVWGELGLSYAYRCFARSYPERQQAVEISYTLPFSFF